MSPSDTGRSETRHDFAIVGGGLVGAATALCLSRIGASVALFAPEVPADQRTSALMGPSVDFLRSHGLVDDPADLAVPLKRIRIIDATERLVRAPETLFDSAEAGLENFGWNFRNAGLLDSFNTQMQAESRLTIITGPVSGIDRAGSEWELSTSSEKLRARMIVGADGRNSFVRKAAGIAVREHRFSQAALVCDIRPERGLDATSTEFHYPHGPFTLVPGEGERAHLVWIDRRETLDAARAGDLPRALFDKSMHLFGAIETLSNPVIFPLSTLVAIDLAQDGLVLVGEAAHAFPPIGAQGLNLGLRDVAELVDIARNAIEKKEWPSAVTSAYARSRRDDVSRTSSLVDNLFRSLLSDFLPAQFLRAGGLWALKLSPSLRQYAFGQGMGRKAS